MAANKYRITFLSGESEEVEAQTIGYVQDGSQSWVTFTDSLGEVRRLRSNQLDRIDRI